MNLGAIIALLKLAQDAELTKLTYLEKITPLYTKEKALERAKQGLGL